MKYLLYTMETPQRGLSYYPVFCKIIIPYFAIKYSLVAQMVKHLSTMQETWVQSLGWEDPLWRRKWQSTPVLLPGKSHGWRSLVQATAHEVPKSRTLSDFTFTFILNI